MNYWSTKEKEALRALVPLGLSGREIAIELSAQFGRPISRSSVNGQCGRLGIRVGDSKAEHRQEKPKPDKAKLKPTPPVLIKASPPPPPTIQMQPCTIFELTSDRCHYALWPNHLRARPDYLFCGAKTNKSPYCEAHEKLVYSYMPEKVEKRSMGLISKSLFR